MTDTFIKASLQKSKTAIIAVSLLASSSLFANEMAKDMETMQKAIIKLIGHYDDTSDALAVVNQKNKTLEAKVAELQTKLKEVQEEQARLKEPKATVEVLGVYATTENTTGEHSHITKNEVPLVGEVMAHTLHIRSEPTANGKHIRYLKHGEVVEISEIMTNESGYPWAKLKSGGYASTKWLKIETNNKD